MPHWTGADADRVDTEILAGVSQEQGGDGLVSGAHSPSFRGHQACLVTISGDLQSGQDRVGSLRPQGTDAQFSGGLRQQSVRRTSRLAQG